MKSPAVVIIMVVMLVLCGIFIQSVIAQDADANATVVEPAAPEATKAPIIPGNSTGNGTDTGNGQLSITGSAVQCAIISFLVVVRMFYQTL
ncbi:uncharacterized protein LOC132935825 [Metopolophium dirhodum]|uniref:uncharacterized protein LOC132935825 n=1 Tax=Metopolophium dirhodum TaxID=44670 RepID=UPI0029903815|nr:uncharacterized protein LOC132935825 [Metopolophium dirhodum]